MKSQSLIYRESTLNSLLPIAPFILAGICALAFILFFWRISNFYGYKSRRQETTKTHLGNTPHNTRQSQPFNQHLHSKVSMMPKTATTKKIGVLINTEKKFTRAEKKVVKKAKDYLASGKLSAAASALESIGLFQDALNILETTNLVEETAQLLARMKRHDRAGLLYARNGMWARAVSCFKLADKPLEVARCAREAEDYETAAEYYDKSSFFKDAAECYYLAGNMEQACALFKRNGDLEKFLSIREELLKKAENLDTSVLDPSELKIIVNHLGSGNTSATFEKLIFARGHINEVIKMLLQRGLNERAAELIGKTKIDDIAPQLINETATDEISSKNLAEAFVHISQFAYAATIYEKYDYYFEAGELYEKTGDLEKAILCFEKSSHKERAIALKAKLSPEPLQPIPPKPVIEEVKTEEQKQEEPVENLPPPPEVQETSHVCSSGDDIELKAVFFKSSFLETLDASQKENLWKIGETTSYASGDVILTYNDEPEGVYIILSGSVNCYRQIGREKKYIDRMSAGKVFGELWLLAEQSTTVQFVASNKDTKLHIIRRKPFQQLLDKDGAIARKVYKRFTMRLLKHLLSPQDNGQNSVAS